MKYRIIIFRVFRQPEYITGQILVFLLVAFLSAGPVSADQTFPVSNMLDAHNAARKEKGIDLLQWSEKIAGYAQDWANYLAENNQCQILHRKEAGKHSKPYGENIYWASSISWSDGRTGIQQIAPADVLDAWTGEEKYYTPATGNCQPGKSCGHYTQVIWEKTRKLGCGMQVCADKSQVWVCNYFPAGNIAGESPLE